MSLAFTSALLWLIPLAGAVLALYLLKMRRKDLRVPASFLWPPMTEEVRANSLFQRLKWNLLLFLQLLALTLLVLALARPQILQTGFGGKVTVIVLDASASMRATDVAPSRFEEAKRLCRDLIDTAGPGDRVSLIEAGPAPRIAFPLSSDRARMRSALAEAAATDADADIAGALRLASSLTSRLESAQILLVSDGVFPEVRDFSPGRASVRFVRVGLAGDNASIRALGITDGPGGATAYCGLECNGARAYEGTLNLFADGRLFDSRRVRIVPESRATDRNGASPNLASSSTTGETFRIPRGAKLIEARLEPPDALAADNYAAAVPDAGARVRVLLVGKGDLFLERALALDPRVTLDRAAALPDSERGARSAYDLIVFDGVRESPVQSKAVWSFGGAAGISPVELAGTPARAPSRMAVLPGHPLMAAVEFEGVFIESMQRVRPKPEGRVLVESEHGPLVVYAEGPQRRLYVAFEPLKSDFPLHVSFPIFVSNALGILVPRETVSGAICVPAGRSFSVGLAQGGAADARIRRVAAAGLDPPSTAVSPAVPSPSSPNRPLLIRGLADVGRYELSAGDLRRTVCATFQSSEESRIEPRDRAFLGGKQVSASTRTSRMGDFWRPFALVALLALLVEWRVFARRS